MSGQKHTPGTWTLFKLREGPSRAVISVAAGPNKDIVCDVYGATTPLLEGFAGACHIAANAHLIAAAPDLLEALKLADAALRGSSMNMKVVQRKVNAAIAKAEGEPQ